MKQRHFRLFPSGQNFTFVSTRYQHKHASLRLKLILQVHQPLSWRNDIKYENGIKLTNLHTSMTSNVFFFSDGQSLSLVGLSSSWPWRCTWLCNYSRQGPTAKRNPSDVQQVSSEGGSVRLFSRVSGSPPGGSIVHLKYFDVNLTLKAPALTL